MNTSLCFSRIGVVSEFKNLTDYIVTKKRDKVKLR